MSSFFGCWVFLSGLSFFGVTFLSIPDTLLIYSSLRCLVGLVWFGLVVFNVNGSAFFFWMTGREDL